MESNGVGGFAQFHWVNPKKNEAKRKGTLLFWLYLLRQIRKFMIR
jgi:hypothetical protein